MNILEADRFYAQDPKKYVVENNKEFFNWLVKSIHGGYNCYISIGELQEMIDTIVNWYEFKYPERELEYEKGITYDNFKDIKSISDTMTLRQLLYRLPHRELCLMECGYRASGWGQHPIYENNKVIEWVPQIYMRINKLNVVESDELNLESNSFLLGANHITGEVVSDYDLDEYIGNDKKLHLEELLSILDEKYADKLDYSELKKCIYNHECDLELRDRILQLAALKMLYSENTIPDRGYIRANRFINEVNKKMGLNLSNDEIVEAFNRDYSKDEDFEETSIVKKEDSKGIKKLARNIFYK